MRRNLLLMLPPALLLAACTESDSPTGVRALNTASPHLLTRAVTRPGTIVAWGEDRFRQVSDTPDGNDFVAVAAGGFHAHALRADGSLVSWGDNENGQVSDAPDGNDFVAVAAGAGHAHALRADGSLVSWGYDEYGQVSDTPEESDFVAVAGGVWHSTALRGDSSLVSWGNNENGPVSDTPGGNDFVAVAAGFRYSTALRADSSLVSWGDNLDDKISDTPDGNDFIAVAAGDFHATALRADGSLVSWGSDLDGRVSDTPDGNDFVAVAAGSLHSTALRADGSLVSWGLDGGPPPAGTDFIALAAGDRAGYAIQVPPSDELPPAITLTSPGDSAAYLLGEEVLADYACTDEQGGSGLASCAGTVANSEPIHTAEVGEQTFVVEATDSAGNTATLTHTYSVTYDFKGFFPPVKNDDFNDVAAGRTVPLMWRLTDASGRPVTRLGSVNVTVEDMGCELGSTEDQLQESAAGGSGLRHLGMGFYWFNWKTPKAYAGSCKTLHLDLGEGITRTAEFRFKQPCGWPFRRDGQKGFQWSGSWKPADGDHPSHRKRHPKRMPDREKRCNWTWSWGKG